MTCNLTRRLRDLAGEKPRSAKTSPLELMQICFFTSTNIQVWVHCGSSARWSCSVLSEQQRAVNSEYIEQRNGRYYVAETRILLDSVIYSFNDGQSQGAIQEDFSSLKRGQIYGAIAFYLDHQAGVRRPRHSDGGSEPWTLGSNPAGAGAIV